MTGGGVLIGTVKHLSDDDWNQVRVEVMSEEAVTTSVIEGEMLNRHDVPVLVTALAAWALPQRDRVERARTVFDELRA